MTIKECYDRLGGDYEDAIRRLAKETLILRVLSMLLEDNSLKALGSALDKGDYKEAFTAAHTLKGIALNLSLTKLSAVASELTEALRGSTASEAELRAMYASVEETYNQVIEAVRELISSQA